MIAAYTKDTVALSQVVDKYFSLDSFDPARANVVKVQSASPNRIGFKPYSLLTVKLCP